MWKRVFRFAGKPLICCERFSAFNPAKPLKIQEIGGYSMKLPNSIAKLSETVASFIIKTQARPDKRRLVPTAQHSGNSRGVREPFSLARPAARD